MNTHGGNLSIGCAAILTAILYALPAAAAPGDRSSDGLWTEVDPSVLGDAGLPLPRAFRLYQLNVEAMQKVLEATPREVPGRGTSRTVITVPLPTGVFAPVAVEMSPLLGPSLAMQYPDIRTFVFHGMEDRAISGRMTMHDGHFQAILRPPSDFARVTPIATDDGTFYLSFMNRDRTDGADDFERSHDEPRDPGLDEPPVPRIAELMEPAEFGIQQLFESGSTLRRYRLAVATTGEYTQAMSGPNGLADVVAAVVDEVSNANLGFEAEFAIRFVLEWVVMYLDPANDPYPTVDGNAVTVCDLRDANPGALDAAIGNAAYDIGFVFNQFNGIGGGCAWYVVCLPDKGRGAGQINTMLTPGSSTGLLLHEMGHQLGARHTFSTNTGSCGNPGEFNQPSAYEPGSGSTIASYLGLCAPNDVDTSLIGAGMYFHTRSFDEIIGNVTVGSGAACVNPLATGNNPPVVDAGADYTIPRGTPFTLTGSAMDPDGDALSYTWEQFDVASGPRAINTDPGDGPLFRSVPPVLNATSRTFPNLADILSNTVRLGEFLPTTDRTLTFRLTARDNRTGGGGVASDTAVLTVGGPPFFITSPNGGEVFGAGCELPVTWTVGGGSVANQVSLDVSNDGGNTFDPLLASTANDGAASGVAPCWATTDARVKASGVGNIFFDISNNDFTIVPTPPTVNVSALGGEVDEACQFTVTFTATVEDDCGIQAAGISVDAIKGGNNFTLGPVQFNAQQVNGTTVHVSGSALVSDVSDSPALLAIKVTGADACGADASDTVQVQVVDATPPEIAVGMDPALLWPPNHAMIPVHANVTVTDNCPGVGFVLTSVTSSEPGNGIGDGNTVNDIQDATLGTPDVDVILRAERSGPGDERVYTLTYTATDASDNQTETAAVVVVPHGKKP